MSDIRLAFDLFSGLVTPSWTLMLTELRTFVLQNVSMTFNSLRSSSAPWSIQNLINNINQLTKYSHKTWALYIHFPNGSDNFAFLYMNRLIESFSDWLLALLAFPATPGDSVTSVGNWKCGISGGWGRIENVLSRIELFIELFKSELFRLVVLPDVLCFGVFIFDLVCTGELTGWPPDLNDGELPSLVVETGVVDESASFEDFRLLLFNENLILSSWFETRSKSIL